MNSQLREELTKYRDTTIELIKAVENENYDILDNYIDQRREIINSIEKLNFTKEEFIIVCNELKILFFQNNLNKLMNEKKLKVKRQLESINDTKNLQSSYNKKFSVDSIFFNKKI